MIVNAPLREHKAIVLGLQAHHRVPSLRSRTPHLAIFGIPQHRRYLEVTAGLAREPSLSVERWPQVNGSRASVPGDGMNLWLFTGVEDGIADAAEGCANVEGQHEPAQGAAEGTERGHLWWSIGSGVL